MNITDKGVDWFYSEVWNSASNIETRDRVERRLNYWNGLHDILDEDSEYANGQTKSTKVMNWIQQIVKRHVGVLTPFQVTADIPEGQTPTEVTTEPLDPYNEMKQAQRFERTDSLLLRDALLCGYGVEFQEYDSASKQITINRYGPSEWSFLWDSDSNLACAVRYTSLAANTIHNGEILESATDLMWLYTEEEYAVCTRQVESGGSWQGEPTANELGIIPVVVWLPDEEMAGVVSDELIAMNDAYNSEFNLEGDDISNTVDCLLKIWGVDSGWAKLHEKEILEKRFMPFDRERTIQDAEYLRRELNIEPHVQHLKTTRENIHIMGAIPDVNEITGATGSTSGIALKLAFTPMEQEFQARAPFYCENVYERIDLINARKAKLSQPQIINPNVDIQFRMPTNRIEEWQNIGNLKGIVSRRTQLSLLTDIADPAVEEQNIVNEFGEDEPAMLAVRQQEQEARAANLERAMVENDARTSEQISAMITANEGLITKLIEAIKNKERT